MKKLNKILVKRIRLTIFFPNPLTFTCITFVDLLYHLRVCPAWLWARHNISVIYPTNTCKYVIKFDVDHNKSSDYNQVSFIIEIQEMSCIKRKGGLWLLKKNVWDTFQLSITMKVFIDFALIPLKIKCYSILQKRPSCMLDISNCDVIYYVIYVIWSHYVGKAISPLFAWPSSNAVYYIIST